MAAENILGIHKQNVQRARWMGMAGREYPALICAKCCFTGHGSGISDVHPSRSQPSQLGPFRSTDKAWRGPLRPPDRATHPMTSAVPGSSSGLLPVCTPNPSPALCSKNTGLLWFLQYAKPTPTRLSEHSCPLLPTPLSLFLTVRSGQLATETSPDHPKWLSWADLHPGCFLLRTSLNSHISLLTGLQSISPARLEPP